MWSIGNALKADTSSALGYRDVAIDDAATDAIAWNRIMISSLIEHGLLGKLLPL
jgi:hypothetical protein